MQVDEFKALVKELHRAGIEVILDVVFNHTAEGDQRGPTLCYRGIDNRTYYMLTPDGYYLNFQDAATPSIATTLWSAISYSTVCGIGARNITSMGFVLTSHRSLIVTRMEFLWRILPFLSRSLTTLC
jgi:hypothetical protein